MAAEMVTSSKVRTMEEMSLEQVCRLLKNGTWDKCAQNPFSSMPEKYVDNLMAYFLSVPTFISTRHMRLVLQSGQLSKLDLSTLLLDDEKTLLLKWLTEDACKNLRHLSLLHPLCGESGVAIVTGILERCHNLEEFHSKLMISPSAFKNCRQLKIVRLHRIYKFADIRDDLYLQTVDFVRSNPNLEVFAFCDFKSEFSSERVTIAILENCPKLTSVGLLDSLQALHHIRKTKGDTIRHLKKCVWGCNNEKSIRAMPDNGQCSYNAEYPDMILNAVNMCPAVETLVMNVHNNLALEHLVHLRHLRSLTLKFHHKRADNATYLRFLLRRIGPLLQHLSLEMEEIPVEIIRDHCFNLKSLQICGLATMHDDKESCLYPFPLERLHIWNSDHKGVFFLLRNSPNLIELYLGAILCLSDQLMNDILLGGFVFPTLAVVGISECILSETGIGMLLDSAPNLKELFFGMMEQCTITHRLFQQRRLNVLHYYDNFKLKKPEFFVFRPDPCSF